MSILGDITFVDPAKDAATIEQLRRDLDAARNTITEMQLEAALHGFDIKLVPEAIIPAKVEPAHVAIRRVRR
jgi:uncharacterized protein (UPF0335 family)